MKLAAWHCLALDVPTELQCLAVVHLVHLAAESLWEVKNESLAAFVLFTHVQGLRKCL